jgi:two-component system nitrogen regulation sensor histidine kinase GlnL
MGIEARPPVAAGEILDGLTTGIVVLDAGGAILFLNSSAQDMFAIGASAARGRPLAELLPPDDAVIRLMRRATETGEPLVSRECELHPLTRADATIHVHCKITPITEQGQPRLLLELSDLTHQQRIKRDNALLAQLGGSRLMARQLAHEIKNPLGGLRGAAQLLERELPSEHLREYTRVIIGEADRLRSLVDNLLGPTRAPQRATANVHELLDHVFHLARSEAPDGIAIIRDYDPSLPTLLLDRDQIIQVMLNLARNAVQVMGTSGQLTLRTRAVTNVTIADKRHRVVAAVQFEDNGPGVPPELRETLFYPLVTARPGGTGLGLAVAQDLATRHGGLIEFDSRPGRTIFTLLLPIEATDEQIA